MIKENGGNIHDKISTKKLKFYLILEDSPKNEATIEDMKNKNRS